uniref:BUD13 homolog n=1 Tax=Neogobius melanostomus TaxID=47308 RepID=A0A8C6WE76_9GOBI
MAASVGTSNATELSKAEYLKRYLSGEDSKKSKGKVKKKRPKIAEVIDDRPEEIKQLEAFRTSNRWKIIGGITLKLSLNQFPPRRDQQPAASGRTRHDSPDISPPRRNRHDSPDISPPRRSRHDSPDASPPRRSRHDSPDISPPRRGRHSAGELSSPRHSGKKFTKYIRSSPGKKTQKRHDTDLDQSPPRKKSTKRQASDSDQSPPRWRSKARPDSESDQSPPRKRPQNRKSADEDLSPPRRLGQSHVSNMQFDLSRMLSGGKAGLVSVDILRKEQEENRRRDRKNRPLEDESRNAQTVFRDKSGKIRDLDSEREEQKKKAGEQAAKTEKYAQWGRGLAQGQMYQQKLEDALLESQKPLARHRDDEELDKMLREQERDGDPMAAMLRRKKEQKPRYKGPAPPPNRFNLLPGYRWDGVDRSNGFEQKRYARMADKKAVQEEAYKWSVEDM